MTTHRDDKAEKALRLRAGGEGLRMTVNNDQAIFDAIVAATGFSQKTGAVLIDTKAFIDTFNGHRDRKLCTSLDVAQTPRDEEIENLREELESAKAQVTIARHSNGFQILDALDAAQTPEIARLRKALRLARARIEYLGTVCPGPTHYDANARTFLPMIDVVLDVQTTPPSKD